MIIGGAKQQEIGHTPILNWYLQLLEQMLSGPDSRMMVIETSTLELLLQRAVIGGSRRRLSEIFGDDETEHEKIMRFFSRP
jgi:hypothetical protein